jgi:glycerol kinase
LALDAGLDVIEAVGTWTPDHTYKPEWSGERAADFLARWTAAADSVLAQKETATT